MLEGKNFPIKVEGKTQLWGFYTTRKVKAESPDEAEIKAVEMIRNDQELLSSLDHDNETEYKIFLDSMYELKWWNLLGGSGYSFYVIEE